MSTKKDTTDTSLEMTSEPKKRPESKYNASILRECIKEGLDAKSIMLDKIITNASEFNECWFNINYDINILREALAEKLRSK